MAVEVDLPNAWQPRGYQLRVWDYLERGGKRGVLVWHRRAGKDSLCLNWTVCAAHDRVGVYWHMLPTAKQGRKVVWDGIDRDGRRIIDQVFPHALRSSTNNTEMRIEMKCGSIWYVCGSDNYDSLVGGNPVGVVFSEYSLSNPAAWDYIRPILAENGGWALFPYTSRGRNHGHRLLEMAKRADSWFAERLTVDDTCRHDGTPVIAPAAIEEDRASGMPEEIVQQEYWCSFDAALVGSYYGKVMQDARREGRIGRVPYDPTVPVETWWDLGIGDAMSIVFVQLVAMEVRFIDYYENTGEGLPHYAKVLGEKPYVYSRHVGPHDIEARELGTGKSRKETALGLGVRFEVAPRLGIDDGIDAVRALLPRAWFDEVKCERLVDALSMYRKEWDDKLKVFKDQPLHDWTSHPADAVRTGAVMRPRGKSAGKTFQADTDFEV